MKLGAVGDDFTGSSDLGLTLAEGGLRTVQYVGVPAGGAAPDVEAGIVALKSRSLPVKEAVPSHWQPSGGFVSRAVHNSCSNIARPSTAPLKATSVRSSKPLSRNWERRLR